MTRNMLVLLGLPLLLICLNESWIFAPLLQFGIDPWCYFGYFLDLKQHLINFPGAYYGTRLPWILPGYLAYRFFSPLVATYLLHLTFYYAANFSLYTIIKRLFNQRTALLAAVLMGCHCFFLKAVGSKYIDGAGLTYFLLTLCMLTPPEQDKHPRLRLSLAGIFYSCLIFTQLFLIVYTPLIVFYRLFIHRTLNLPPLKFRWGYFALGFGGLTLFLCLLNDALNGNFFFYMTIVNWTTDFVSRANPWWMPLSLWWKNATWLVSSVITLCASLLTLIYYRTLKLLPQGRTVLFFQVYFILFVLLHAVLEFIFHQPVLRYFYYASYLIPVMFLALGSLLSLVVETKYFYKILAGIIVTFYTAHTLVNDYQNVQLISLPLWGIVLVGIGGVVAVVISRYKAMGLGLVVTALLMIHIVDANTKQASHIGASHIHKQFFLTVIKGEKTVQKVNRKGDLLFWYDSRSPLAYIFRSIASTYLWQYRLLNEEFPQVNDKINIQSLTSRKMICILSENPNVIEAANQNLAPFGLKGELVKKKIIQYESCNFNMVFLKLHPLGSHAHY